MVLPFRIYAIFAHIYLKEVRNIENNPSENEYIRKETLNSIFH